MSANVKIRSIIVVGIFLIPFLFGTSPLPPPYHKYRVSGSIERQSGGPKGYYVVSLVAKFSFASSDTILDIAPFSPMDGGTSVTDTSGFFYLDVRALGKADSIAIKVSAADRPPYISPNWLVPSTFITVVGENTSGEPGCSGCGTTDAATSPSIVGYIYLFENQHVLIPD